jgi:hypothetical protein
VPEDVYDRYFELEEQLHPEFYSRGADAGAIDELSDACPGPLVYMPAGEQYYSISTTCGQTYNATNDCTYPNCRYGRDVIMQIDVWYPGLIRMTTTGSRFDTYLCLYNGNCCGEEGSYLIGSNNNNPGLCNGQALAAGMEDYVSPGTYWLVLDGAGPAARGSYCLTVEFWVDN